VSAARRSSRATARPTRAARPSGEASGGHGARPTSALAAAKPDVPALERFLQSLGVDGARNQEYAVTAALLAELLVEYTSGLREERPMLRPLPYNGRPDEIVSVEGIVVYGLCPHHLVPYLGEVRVRYMPSEQVSGAGAMVRYVRDLARVPRLQEDVTQAIADGVHDFLEPVGVEVWMRARHLCMELRGSGSRARLVTEARRGEPLPPLGSGRGLGIGPTPKRPAR
jgi:GTP cyclohydrolase I